MIHQKERQQVVEYGKKLITSNLTRGTGGNISVYIPKEKQMAITPSGIDYYKLSPQDIVILDLDGNIIDGKHKPSSEYLLHKIFYENRKDINAVVHVHSIYSTILACMNWEMPAVHYLVATGGGGNVPCAEYATFGTQQLANNAYSAMQGRNAVFLANHGLLTGAANLKSAFNKAEEIEFCAEVYYKTKTLGEAKILDHREMDKMLELFQSYGSVKEIK